jgi:microcystin-dependent protein
MSYSTPKTDWTSVDPVSNSDLNRIEGNIVALKEENIEIEGNKTFSGNNTHSGDDTISGNKTMNSPIRVGTIVDNDTIQSGSNTDNRDTTHTGVKDFTEATVALPSGIAGIIPVDGIILWSGAVGEIPANWHLCDGSAGTPDLRGRFVIGAGGSYDPDDNVAAPTHNHGANTGNHTLTIAEIPSHKHDVSDSGHTHDFKMRATVTNGSTYPKGAASGGSTFDDTTKSGTANISESSKGGGGAHNHSISGSTALPPYYSLCYIQRIA